MIVRMTPGAFRRRFFDILGLAVATSIAGLSFGWLAYDYVCWYSAQVELQRINSRETQTRQLRQVPPRAVSPADGPGLGSRGSSARAAQSDGRKPESAQDGSLGQAGVGLTPWKDTGLQRTSSGSSVLYMGSLGEASMAFAEGHVLDVSHAGAEESRPTQDPCPASPRPAHRRGSVDGVEKTPTPLKPLADRWRLPRENACAGPGGGQAANVQTGRSGGVTAGETALRGRAITIANEERVDPPILLALVADESSWNPRAVGKHGEQGLLQLKVETVRWCGKPFDRFQAEPNLRCGARYLRAQFEEFGTWELAVAAFKAGPGAVPDAIPAHSWAYVQRTLRKAEALR